MFQPAHIKRWREQHPQGIVISHPECNFEVCLNSDYVGSTEHILKTDQGSAAQHAMAGRHRTESGGTAGQRSEAEGKTVQFMAPTVCMCSTMQRIDPQHLAWTLENLADGNIVNPIRVPPHEAELAKLALERMLAVS
jgi:quinolinate synthase